MTPEALKEQIEHDMEHAMGFLARGLMYLHAGNVDAAEGEMQKAHRVLVMHTLVVKGSADRSILIDWTVQMDAEEARNRAVDIDVDSLPRKPPESLVEESQ